MLAAAIAVIVVPLLVPCIQLLAHRGPFYLVADPALLDVDVRTALSWHQLLGPYDRYGWHHPGPALAYLLATIERIVGTGPVGDIVGTALINAAAAIGTIVLVRRRCGDLAGLWTAAALGYLCWSVGPPNLLAPWGPDVLAIPTVYLGALCADASRRRLVSLMGAFVVGTFLVQTQLATLPIALGMILAAVILAAVHCHGRAQPQPTRTTAFVVGLLSLLLILCWLPPVIEQIARIGKLRRVAPVSALHPSLPQVDPSQGNFVAIFRFFLASHAGHGIASVFSLLVPDPLAFALFIACIAAAVVFGRGVAYGFAGDLGIITLVAATTTLAAITQIVGPIQWFDLTWDKAVGVLAAVALGVTALSRVEAFAVAEEPPEPDRIVQSVRLGRLLTTAALVTVVVSASVAGASSLVREANFQVRDLDAASMQATWPFVAPALKGKTSVYLRPLDAAAYGVTAGILDQLVARDVRATVPASWSPEFGLGRVTTGKEQLEVLITVGPYSGDLQLRHVPGAPSIRLLVVARHDPDRELRRARAAHPLLP